MRKKINFTQKIFFAELITIVALCLSVITFFISYYLSREEKKLNNSLETLTSSIASQTDSLLYSADTLALQIASSPTIVNLFSDLDKKSDQKNIFEQQPFLRQDITDFLTSYNFKDSLATRISVYRSPHYVHMGYVTDDLASINFLASEKYKNIENFFLSGAGKNLFLPPHKDIFLLDKAGQDGEILFSIIRGIRNPSLLNATYLGYVEVQLTFSKLSDLFANLDSSIQGYILNNEGEILYPASLSSTSFDMLSVSENECLIAKCDISEAPLTVILTQEKDYIYQSSIDVIRITIAAFAGVLLITAAAHFLLIRHFTRPLMELEESLKQVTLENLKLNLLTTNENDTIKKLNIAFSNLLEYLKNSMHETITAQTSEIESHFLALQAQINPHFFHNTLSVISAIAAEHDIKQIEDICSKLSYMLRFSTSYKENSCTILEEMTYAGNYLSLMADRYEGMFFSECQIDDSCKNVVIPKLVVQPLLENCFHHGFRNKLYPWIIKVSACQKNDCWIIVITDNGDGFHKEFLSRFENETRKMDIYTIEQIVKNLEIGGLSLVNIYFRLKYWYGDDMIFELSNCPEGGAEIKIGGTLNDTHSSCRRRTTDSQKFMPENRKTSP